MYCGAQNTFDNALRCGALIEGSPSSAHFLLYQEDDNVLGDSEDLRGLHSTIHSKSQRLTAPPTASMARTLVRGSLAQGPLHTLASICSHRASKCSAVKSAPKLATVHPGKATAATSIHGNTSITVNSHRIMPRDDMTWRNEQREPGPVNLDAPNRSRQDGTGLDWTGQLRTGIRATSYRVPLAVHWPAPSLS